MSATSVETIADIVVPDTALVRDVTEFIRDAEDDLLFDHSRRVFLFGALQGHRRGLQPDLELLYVGAMFHDLGLTDRYRASSSLRFEVDSANAARDFLLERGVRRARCPQGLAEHRPAHHPGSARVPRPRNRPGHRRCRDRRTGHRPRRPVARRDCECRAAHPRPDFKRRILHAFTEGIHTPSAHHVRHGQRRRAAALRRVVRPRRLRRDHPGNSWPE